MKKFDLDKDIFAYIEEAGDEGQHLKSSKWFVVSGIVFKYKESQRARELLNKKFIPGLKKKKKNISFKKLNHNQRKDLAAYIAQTKYLSIHSAFCKNKLSQQEMYLNSYPSMYFVGVKNVVERLSWIAHQYKCRKVHIKIANRNTIKLNDIKNYIIQNRKNNTYVNKIGHICLGNSTDDGIIIADCIASSMFQCIEPTGVAQIGENAYFNICIKDNLFKSNHPQYKGIWNNGFKCIPRNPKIIKNGILTEGSTPIK